MSGPYLFRFTLFMSVSLLSLKIIEVSARLIDLRGSAHLPQQQSTLALVSRLVSEVYGWFMLLRTNRHATDPAPQWLVLPLHVRYVPGSNLTRDRLTWLRIFRCSLQSLRQMSGDYSKLIRQCFIPHFSFNIHYSKLNNMSNCGLSWLKRRRFWF
jgi:hypothetical protein